MGRYTTVQTYSDQNTKIVSGYGGPATTDRAHASSTNEGHGSAVRLQVNKVDNVMGSCAGAGSGEFHMYRAARQRELTRLENIEKKQKEEEELKTYTDNVERNRLEALERTRKNAEKRKKKIEKKRKFSGKNSSPAIEGETTNKAPKIENHGDTE